MIHIVSMHGNRNLAQGQILVPQDKMHCMYSTEIVNNTIKQDFGICPNFKLKCLIQIWVHRVESGRM